MSLADTLYYTFVILYSYNIFHTFCHPINDEACSAIDISGPFPITLHNVTNINATIDGNGNLDDCIQETEINSDINVTSPSVWYRMLNVNNLSITTLNSNFDTKLSVYTMNDCDNLSTISCITGHDGLFESAQISIDRCYEELYILLSGFSTELTNQGVTDILINATCMLFISYV